MKASRRHTPDPMRVPVPRLGWRGTRLSPALGFAAIVLLHEVLACIAATKWLNGDSFVYLQTGWYCIWELALLSFFLINHIKIGNTIATGKLILFWLAQAAWFGLGLWCFGVLFVDQPFAIEGVGGWLIVAFILAVVTEDHDGEKTSKEDDDSYFFKTFRSS